MTKSSVRCVVFLGLCFSVLIHTVHDIGFIEVWICLLDFRSIAVLTDVVIEVPTQVLIKDSKHGVLLLVCSYLEENY